MEVWLCRGGKSRKKMKVVAASLNHKTPKKGQGRNKVQKVTRKIGALSTPQVVNPGLQGDKSKKKGSSYKASVAVPTGSTTEKKGTNKSQVQWKNKTK